SAFAILGIEDHAAMAVGIAKVLTSPGRAIELVGRNVVAELVAAVLGEPQLTGLGVPVEAERVADPAGVDLELTALMAHPGDAGEVRLVAEAIVTGGADCQVQAPIGAEANVSPAVVMQARQRVADELGRGRIGEPLANLREAKDPIDRGHIEIAVTIGDSVGGIEIASDGADLVDPPVAVGVDHRI